MDRPPVIKAEDSEDTYDFDAVEAKELNNPPTEAQDAHTGDGGEELGSSFCVRTKNIISAEVYQRTS